MSAQQMYFSGGIAYEFLLPPYASLEATSSSITEAEKFGNLSAPLRMLQTSRLVASDGSIEGVLIPQPNVTLYT